MKNIALSLLLIALFLNSCEKDPTGSNRDEARVRLNGAFVLNEGNFGKANGSLSFYSFEDQAVINNIYKTKNGKNLGDVVNSMTIKDTLGFIIVNNSNKIEIISTSSWKWIKTIEMPVGASPRNLAFDSRGRGWVTNLMTNDVTVLSAADYTVEKNIAVGPNPEEILIVNEKAYVANSGFGWNNTISVIDVRNDKVVKTLRVGDNPTALMLDDDDELHVLCSGRWPAWNDTTDPGTDGGIYIIDPESDSVKDSLKISGHPTEITYGGNDTGYFLNGGISTYSTKTNKLLQDSFISGFYYGLEADPVSRQLFVLDPQNYSQNGLLFIYDFSGNLIAQHEVGMIPGAVTFVYEQAQP